MLVFLFMECFCLSDMILAVVIVVCVCDMAAPLLAGRERLQRGSGGRGDAGRRRAGLPVQRPVWGGRGLQLPLAGQRRLHPGETQRSMEH